MVDVGAQSHAPRSKVLFLGHQSNEGDVHGVGQGQFDDCEAQCYLLCNLTTEDPLNEVQDERPRYC